MAETNNPHNIHIKLALDVPSLEKDSHAREDLEYELSMRPHILTSRVHWQPVSSRLIVEISIEGNSPELLANHFSEELWEIANAILNEIEGMHVQILSFD